MSKDVTYTVGVRFQSFVRIDTDEPEKLPLPQVRSFVFTDEPVVELAFTEEDFNGGEGFEVPMRRELGPCLVENFERAMQVAFGIADGKIDAKAIKSLVESCATGDVNITGEFDEEWLDEMNAIGLKPISSLIPLHA